MSKKRKIPLRKCVVSNEMKPKEEMIRIVRTKEGDVFVDPTGKKNGRGAYVSKDIALIEQAEKSGALNKQFETKVNPEIYEQLKAIIRGS